MPSHNRNTRANGKRVPLLSFGKCYKCGRYTVFTRKRAMLCPRCSDKATPKLPPFPKDTAGLGRMGNFKYRRARAKAIKEHPYCQLCGATSNLTAHHVGGRMDIGLTILCKECHQAYESWHHRTRMIKD